MAFLQILKTPNGSEKDLAENTQAYLLNTSYYTRTYVYIMLSIS